MSNGPAQPRRTISRRGMGPLGNAFVSLGVRDYRYLVLSNFSSQIGLWIAMVAEGWLAFQLTGSATYLGAVSAARAIPGFILTLPGGVLADRLDRRRVIAVSQLLLAINAAVVSYLVLSDLIQPWHLLVSSIVTGVAGSINMPARQALAPQLAGRQFIANAVALNAISFNASRILGPSIAGLILAHWGIGPCYACYTVLLAVAMVWVMRISPAGGTQGQATSLRTRGSMWSNMIEGLQYIRRSREISSIMAVAIIPIYLEMVYQNLLPVFADDVLDVGGPGLAKMVTAVGVGSMIGGFITAALSTYRRKGVVMLTVGLFSGVTLIVFAVSRSLELTIVMLAITGLTQSITMSMSQTMINLVVANELRGRVMAVYMMLWSSSPVAMLPAGILTDHLGPSFTVALSGVLVVLFFIAATARRSVVRDFTEEEVLMETRTPLPNPPPQGGRESHARERASSP